MATNPYLAAALFRAKDPTIELRKDIWLEEAEERRLEEERRRGIETRERKFGTARGRGRVGGGLLGLLIGTALAPATGGASLLIPALAAGAGSYLGQKGAVAVTPGAMKKFERIGPGKYYIARGREREREFRFGEKERERYISELMMTSAAWDALSGYGAAKYGGGILRQILGETGMPLLHRRWTPRAGGF